MSNMGPLGESREMDELLEKERVAATGENPQLPDAGDETNVDVFQTARDVPSDARKAEREIRIYGTDRGGLEVYVTGRWNGRLLRGIPAAIAKKIALARKEFISNEEE